MTPEIRTAAQKLIDLIERQTASGLITRDVIRAKDELRVLLSRNDEQEKARADMVMRIMDEIGRGAHE